MSATACVVTAVTLRVGTTATSISLLDGSAGTSQLIVSNVGVTAAGDTTLHFPFPNGLAFPNGLYMTLAGTGATAYVTLQPN